MNKQKNTFVTVYTQALYCGCVSFSGIIETKKVIVTPD